MNELKFFGVSTNTNMICYGMNYDTCNNKDCRIRGSCKQAFEKTYTKETKHLWGVD